MMPLWEDCSTSRLSVKSSLVSIFKSFEWILPAPHPPVSADVTVKLLKSIIISEAPDIAVKVGTNLFSSVSKIPSLSSSKSRASITPSLSLSVLGKGWLATSMFSKERVVVNSCSIM